MNDNEENLEYAGFWIRVGATLIDSIILLAIITPILWMYYGDGYLISDDSSLGAVDIFLNYVFPAIAATVYWIYKSATPGKIVLGLKILDSRTGENISSSQAIVRYVSYYIAILPFMLGILWVGWDRKKQGWHDKIAKTVVVKDISYSTENVRFNNK